MTKKKSSPSSSSSSTSSYGIGDLCENISESISNLSKPCEDYANAQRIQSDEQRRFADLELAASTSTPYPLTHHHEEEEEEEGDDDRCSSISISHPHHHPVPSAVVGCVTGAIPAMVIGLAKQSHHHHHHLGKIGSSVSSVPLNDNHEQHNNNNKDGGPILRPPQQQQQSLSQIQNARKIAAALPLHRKSSILCTTPDPQMTSSSKLRQRKLHKRSSMLCDGYALLDCLHEEAWSETTGNTEKGSALIRAEPATTTRSSRSRASKWSSTNNSIEARSTGSSSSCAKFSRTPSMIKRTPSQEFERYTKMYSDMTSHHHHSKTIIDNDDFIPPGIPLSISRSQGVESVSIATFASDAGFATATAENNHHNNNGGGESSQQNRYSSINNNNNNNNIRNPRSPKHYRRFASNEAFASSLRRSVQVLQKHDSHHMGGSRTNNNKKIMHRKDSFTSQLFDTKQQLLRSGGGGGGGGEQGGAEAEDGGVEFDTITGSKQTTTSVVPPPEQFPPPSTDDEIEAIIVDREQAAAAGAKSSSTTTTYPSKGNINNGKSALQFMTALHLSAFAILGALFRIFLVWLFSGAGGDCSSNNNNNNVWCVTSTGLDGNGSGVFFEELPANMVGSFLMGVLQKPSQDLRLLVASDMGIAFLPSQHWFQDWGIFHLGLRTGFCGSLSTFASWNTQMVQMIDGSASTTTNNDGSGSGGGGSNWVSAIFGYILGLQMSLACLSLGQEVAIWMYRKSNPALAKEEDVLMYAYTKDAQIAGVNGELQGNGVDDDDHSAAIRRQKLPDYEMRYLASLLPNEELRWATQNVGILKNLERWKVSTDETRLAGDPNMKEVRVLHQIEEAILVDEAEPSNELLEIASEKGWDVEALKQFAKDAHGVSVASNRDNNNTGGRRRGNNNRGSGGGRMKMGSVSEGSSSTSSGFLPIERTAIIQAFVGYLPFVSSFVLVLVLIVLDVMSNDDDDSIAYRHFWVSSLLAPLGAVLRWELSRFNGRLKGSLQWLPLGTFAANITASIISAAISGINDSSRIVNSNTLLYAIETGFAGSLSTVSSFVAEGNAMQSTYPHHAKAYYYMVGSLMVACAFGLIFYSSLVRTG